MTKKVKIGGLYIGGGERVAIQSMANIKTSQTDSVIKQIKKKKKAGCDIIRTSVLDETDISAITEIKKHINIPLVADIHFNYRFAIEAIKAGADKVRINPGNIGSDKNVEEVAKAIKSSGVAVRVGSNSGSVEKSLLQKYGKNEISLAESALKNVALLEKYGVENIVILALPKREPCRAGR